MNLWTSAFFTASNGTKLHYYRTGGEKTPLILVHGMTDDGLCWTALAKDLEENYDIIMLDLRGHGKSDGPDDGYDFVTISGEVADLVEELGLDKPVVMGHSLGAMTALSVGAYYPELPRALILEDPPPFWNKKPATDEELAHRAEMEAWFRQIKRLTQAELLATVRAENPSWAEVEHLPWVESKHRFSSNISKIVDSQKTVRADFSAKIGSINCPILLFTASPDLGAILTPEDVSDLAESLPQLMLTNIPNAGHHIRREAYPIYLQTLQEFLEGI